MDIEATAYHKPDDQHCRVTIHRQGYPNSANDPDYVVVVMCSDNQRVEGESFVFSPAQMKALKKAFKQVKP